MTTVEQMEFVVHALHLWLGQRIKITGITDKSQAPDLDFGLSASVLANKDEVSVTVE